MPPLSFLKSYLQDRTQYVFLNGQYSSEGIIAGGVLQGSVRVSLLFSILFIINDLSLHISNDKVVSGHLADDNSVHSC